MCSWPCTGDIFSDDLCYWHSRLILYQTSWSRLQRNSARTGGSPARAAHSHSLRICHTGEACLLKNFSSGLGRASLCTPSTPALLRSGDTPLCDHPTSCDAISLARSLLAFSPHDRRRRFVHLVFADKKNRRIP